MIENIKEVLFIFCADFAVPVQFSSWPALLPDSCSFIFKQVWLDKGKIESPFFVFATLGLYFLYDPSNHCTNFRPFRYDFLFAATFEGDSHILGLVYL